MQPPQAPVQTKLAVSNRTFTGVDGKSVQGNANRFVRCHNMAIKGERLYLEDCTECTVVGKVDLLIGGDNIRVDGLVTESRDVSVNFSTNTRFFTFSQPRVAPGDVVVTGRRSPPAARSRRKSEPKPRKRRSASPERRRDGGGVVAVRGITAGRMTNVGPGVYTGDSNTATPM